MSRYFRYFPTVQYDLIKDGNEITLTNIMRRFVVDSKLKEQIDIFYDYTIQAGDRPDVIAEKYYGDANLAWLVLHFNDITDPFFGWGLNDVDLENYIRGKYGSIPAAQAEVHEYRQVLNEARTFYDGTVIPKRYVVVDDAFLLWDTWNISTTYNKGDTVKYTDPETNVTRGYIALQDNMTGENPKSNPTKWQLAGDPVSKYDYEVEQNDKKRQIKILDKRYVDQVIAEVKTILKDGI